MEKLAAGTTAYIVWPGLNPETWDNGLCFDKSFRVVAVVVCERAKDSQQKWSRATQQLYYRYRLQITDEGERAELRGDDVDLDAPFDWMDPVGTTPAEAVTFSLAEVVPLAEGYGRMRDRLMGVKV